MFATLVTAATNAILGKTENVARRFLLELKYEGADISADVAPFVISFSYADRTDKIDEISIVFEDTHGLWSNSWWPERGAKLAAKFRVENWFNPGDSFERDCGQFEIDDFSSSGPPSTATIKAVAVGISSSIRRQQNDKSWENTEIKLIAQDIADRNGFELKWYSNYNPTLERWQQNSQSDLACLKAICDYAGLILKITDKALVIFRGEEFDKTKPEITIRKVGDGVKIYSFNTNSSDIYSACLVTYYDPTQRKFLEYLFKPDGISGLRGGGSAKKEKAGPTSKQVINQETRMVETVAIPKAKKAEPAEITEPEIGQVLKINRRFTSLAEAEEMAKAALRNKNMQQVKGSMGLMGRPDLYSGLNFTAQGFGRWDSSVYSLEEVTHDYSKSGYNSSIQFRGILGY